MKHKPQFCLELQHLPIQCKASCRRKTLGLKVVPGKVIVSYPNYASIQEVTNWVNNRSDWILHHFVESPPIEFQKPLSAADQIYWGGFKVSCADLVAIQQINSDIFFSATLAQQKSLLLELCKRAAEADFPERVVIWEVVLGYRTANLKLRPYSSRWGSCTHRSEVALNTLLMMAPDWVRDYVVVHELCHIKHFDHSVHFWNDVSRACSQQQIKSAKKWLRLNGSQLMFIYR